MDSLIGITAGDWWKLLKQNKFGVDLLYWPKALVLTYLSILNSVYSKKEERIYHPEIRNVKIEKAPIFILGHWRSGTTLLQNLLALDKQFAYPTVFQCNHPHTFLNRERRLTKLIAKRKLQARPMDNVEVTPLSPSEEEFALGIMSLRSPLFAWPFPRHEDFYDQYLTFKAVPKEEVRQWQVAFMFFVKKLTWRFEKQLVLKSPANTGRIGLLLELFPDAKFVHIHRNPYVVFQSTKRLYEKAVAAAYLQHPRTTDFTNGIIKRYAEMYDAFFAERDLIPHGNYLEICFEELDRDQFGQVQKIYEYLKIPNFDKFQPTLKPYVESIADYKKSKHPHLDETTRQNIIQAWRRSFEEWGYQV